MNGRLTPSGLVLACCALLTACGPAVNGTWRGPPLATLQGQLTLKEGLSVGPVRLAIAWYPKLDGEAPAPPRAIVTEELAYTGSFPQNFTFQLFAPPAQGALEVVEHEDGTVSEAAVGQLLAYEDLDGDGKLTVDEAGRSGDRLLGSTAGAGPFDFFSSEQRDVVAWVKHADDLGLASQGMRPGYNLLRATNPFVPPAVLALDTPIPLRLSGDPRLALIVCPEAFANPNADQACGVTVWTTPAVNGSITLQDDGSLDALVMVQAGGSTTGEAAVSINGVAVPVDASGTSYSLTELTPSVLRVGRNVVEVRLAGYSPVELETVVPARFEVLAPAAGAQVRLGSTLQLRWTEAAGATQYSASLFVAAASSQTAFTASPEATLVVPEAEGPGQLSITAFERLMFSRAAVLGLSTRSVELEVIR